MQSELVQNMVLENQRKGKDAAVQDTKTDQTNQITEDPDSNNTVIESASDLLVKGNDIKNSNQVELINGHVNAIKTNTISTEMADSNANVVDAKVENSDTTKENDSVEKAQTETPVIQKEGEDAQNENLEDLDLEALHDNDITVTIQNPGNDTITVQLSSMELVQEIHQLLMDREDSCHRTCFSLQLGGVTLDNFAELKTIEDLKNGSVIKVIEDPYTMREARIHVRHVRDLLKSVDPADAYNGVDCNSLSFLHTITQGDLLEKKKPRVDAVDCTPPAYIMPGAKDIPLLPLHPGIKKGPQALKVLTTSAWNPPPGPRKLHGDLMYLYVVTMEDKRFHISACPRGFYINQSTDDVFNPKPDNPSHLSHSLIDLLSHISPTFKRAFQQMQKKRTLRHAFERVATPYQVYQWAAPTLDHTQDAIRAEDAFSSKLGYEEHIPGQTRDWNEELQTTRELPRKTISERLLRERAMFKVHGDFVIAATRGAMAVIDGNVLAINPGEDPKMQMFIWNNIFFSLGFDVRDHYKDLGGDVAAFVAPRNDMHGVCVYSGIDIEGLYTLGTVVVDYRGYRVTAQSIIPGILEREQEQSVVYGSIDFGKTVLTHPKYLELLHKVANYLKILPHYVLNERDEPVELCSSVECKGIIGNDGRHYILDLLRTFPPDVNFQKLDDVELSPKLKEMGFPIEHKHKLSCLRQELLNNFIESRYVSFIRNAGVHLNEWGMKRRSEGGKDSQESDNRSIESGKDDSSTAINNNNQVKDISDLKKEPTNEQTLLSEKEKKITKEISNEVEEKQTEKTIKDQVERGVPLNMLSALNEARLSVNVEKEAIKMIKSVCAAVGSVKEMEFEIRFNPDVFSPGIRHVDDPDGPNPLSKQKKIVQDAAEYLVLKQIPSFVQGQVNHTSSTMDGAAIVEAMHSVGINVRYLGKIITLIANDPQKEYLHRNAVMELIVRAAKHIYYPYMQNTDPMHLAASISHFLNCFLSSGPVNPTLNTDENHKQTKRGKNKKSNKGGKTSFGNENNDWVQMTSKSLWNHIRKECKQYWDYDLQADSIDAAVENYGLQRISILRSFCLKVGIQVLLREYSFESRNKPTFTDEDITNVFPIVKHISPRASDASKFYTTGQAKIHQAQFKQGYELISEALNLLNHVFGALHNENGACLRMLARLSYVTGDVQEALAILQRAVIMSERVNGIDHPCTISEYTHLALYCFANGQVPTSLKLLYRARYLLILISGESHPEVGLIDSNIGLILHVVGEYELSLRFIEHALKLNKKYFGEKSMHVALSYQIMARTLSCMGDFRGALNNEKETYSIYKSQLGEAHEKTRQCAEGLRLLTHQAVLLQRKMNDIYSNGKFTGGLPPIQINPPSMGSVLDMLNSINGILFVYKAENLDKLKTDIEKVLGNQPEMSTVEMLIRMAAMYELPASDQETETAELTNGDATDSDNHDTSTISTELCNGNAALADLQTSATINS